MNNNYDELESQIGDLGGENTQSNPQNDSLVLKKLKHKTSYGAREDLTEQEQQSLDNFLSKRKNIGNSRTITDNVDLNSNNQINVSDGWVPVNREEMGMRSMFYPKEWEFFIHPATVNAIKNWASIDEERIEQINRVFNEIIKSCVKIDTHSDIGAGWAQINSWDRFWFILKVREYTFSVNETKIEFEDNCSECDELIKYTLTSDSLFYDYPDIDLIESYWDAEHGVWNIDPAEYNLDSDIITLYTPKLGKDQAIIDWAVAKVQESQKNKLDENFINVLPWLLNKPAKTQQMLDHQIQKLYNDFKSWSIDKYQFMMDVIKNITINPSEQLKVKCPHCGMEATSTVKFPNGIKVLFNIKSKVKKFGSR